MRLKLVLLTSLIGTVLGAGASIAVTVGVLGRRGLMMAGLGYRTDDWIGFLILAISFVTAVITAFFVYRHTARRRKTQATITGILVLILSVAAFALTVLLASR